MTKTLFIELSVLLIKNSCVKNRITNSHDLFKDAGFKLYIDNHLRDFFVPIFLKLFNGIKDRQSVIGKFPSLHGVGSGGIV